MVKVPNTVSVHVGRWDAAVHVWRKLGSWDVPRRQRLVACLIAFAHRPMDVELPVEYRRPT